MFVLITLAVIPQQVSRVTHGSKAKPVNHRLNYFLQLAAEANVAYSYPEGFKEIPVLNSNDDFSFDYALELPGQDFEIWLRVRSQRRIQAYYHDQINDNGEAIDNPDSLYNKTGLTLANTFGGGQSYFTTIIPPDYLARYNATEGKTYLLDLADARETKHYKYALLITLHKDHVGTIIAVCFGNEKGSEFFKNIFKASKCLKFKS